MADVFQLTGSIGTTPGSGAPSGKFTLVAPLDETLALKRKHQDEVELTSDSPETIEFGGVLDAHVVMLKVTDGGKVRARLTSADGSSQAVPVDPFALILARSVPYTAIDLTRVAGTDTTVEIFLGEKA